MPIPIIHTARLSLRPWKIEDTPILFEILHEEKILQYFPNPHAPGREKVEAYITHHLAHWEEHGFGHWAVVVPGSGQILGWNGLEYLPELDEVEVAYLLSRQAWGHGYATEIARAAVRFGFEQADLEAIIGLVDPANLGSVRVLEKTGLDFIDRIALWGMEMSRYRVQRLKFLESN